MFRKIYLALFAFCLANLGLILLIQDDNLAGWAGFSLSAIFLLWRK